METLFLALRVLVALAAVLGLIWVVQRRLTRGSGKKGALAARLGGAPKRAIQVHGSHRLSAKASVTVVEIDGVKLVLGVTEQGISVLEPTPTPAATPVVVTIAHPEAVVTPGSDRTQVAAAAEETHASADVPEPVDFAAVLREALDEAAEAPVVAPVVASVAEPVEAEVAPRRRRRTAVPALAEQLLPHMTKTLAAAIGMRVDAPEAAPAEPAPASVARPSNRALAAFLENATPDPAPVAATTPDYSNARPLFERLPVLQRAS